MSPLIRHSREIIDAARDTHDAEALAFMIAHAIDTLNSLQEAPCLNNFTNQSWKSQEFSTAWH